MYTVQLIQACALLRLFPVFLTFSTLFVIQTTHIIHACQVNLDFNHASPCYNLFIESQSKENIISDSEPG